MYTCTILHIYACTTMKACFNGDLETECFGRLWRVRVGFAVYAAESHGMGHSSSKTCMRLVNVLLVDC
jgi:hypothetical protein